MIIIFIIKLRNSFITIIWKSKYEDLFEKKEMFEEEIYVRRWQTLTVGIRWISHVVMWHCFGGEKQNKYK